MQGLRSANKLIVNRSVTSIHFRKLALRRIIPTLGNLAKVRQIDELNKELNAVKAELTGAEYDHQRLMLLLMISCLVTLILFATCMLLLKRRNGSDRQVFKGLKS